MLLSPPEWQVVFFILHMVQLSNCIICISVLPRVTFKMWRFNIVTWSDLGYIRTLCIFRIIPLWYDVHTHNRKMKLDGYIIISDCLQWYFKQRQMCVYRINRWYRIAILSESAVYSVNFWASRNNKSRPKGWRCFSFDKENGRDSKSKIIYGLRA